MPFINNRAFFFFFLVESIIEGATLEKSHICCRQPLSDRVTSLFNNNIYLHLLVSFCGLFFILIFIVSSHVYWRSSHHMQRCFFPPPSLIYRSRFMVYYYQCCVLSLRSLILLGVILIFELWILWFLCVKRRWPGNPTSHWWLRMCRLLRLRLARSESRFSSLLSATLMLTPGAAR